VSWYRDNFCKCHKIVDPYLLDVNNYQEANLLFACYAVFLALGHTLLCKTIKSATIDNYLRAAATVVKRACSQVPNPTNNRRWHDPLIDMTTGKRDSQISSILAEVKRWEKMPNRCEPLTVDMVLYQQLQCATNEPHSEASAMYDWEVFGIYAGNRLTKWAQRDSTDIILNIDESPEAFIISDIEFFGENRRRCSLQFALQHPRLIHTATVTWRFQKNGENGEKKIRSHIRQPSSLCSLCTPLHRSALGGPQVASDASSRGLHSRWKIQ
jgi:hypothetical protein